MTLVILYTDLIAIPDFPTGAMENWGLITFRLTSILYNPGKSSDSNRQWVAVVVAHELAHQVKSVKFSLFSIPQAIVKLDILVQKVIASLSSCLIFWTGPNFFFCFHYR